MEAIFQICCIKQKMQMEVSERNIKSNTKNSAGVNLTYLMSYKDTSWFGLRFYITTLIIIRYVVFCKRVLFHLSTFFFLFYTILVSAWCQMCVEIFYEGKCKIAFQTDISRHISNVLVSWSLEMKCPMTQFVYATWHSTHLNCPTIGLVPHVLMWLSKRDFT